MDTLAVFRKRSDAIKVTKALREKRLICATVSTPSYLKLGCGLSVVFNRGYEQTVRETIREQAADSFYGFFSRS